MLQATLTENFARQGFAATELVTRWADIVGAEIAAHAEPLKIQWPRPIGDAPPEPATLILRVEGPAALEIQHQSSVLLERVNRFFGWQAVGRIALRQAPLARRKPKPQRPAPDPAETARIAASLPAIDDDDLRQALARLGAAVKRK
ncbi:MAG TPA: DciA family protein [Pseudolabrys sp.]|nr:DciA family protein [Pseudolabrys sp.]